MPRFQILSVALLAVLAGPCAAQTCKYDVRAVAYKELVAHLYVPRTPLPMPVVIAVGGAEGGLGTGDANGELLLGNHPAGGALVSLILLPADASSGSQSTEDCP